MSHHRFANDQALAAHNAATLRKFLTIATDAQRRRTARDALRQCEAWIHSHRVGAA